MKLTETNALSCFMDVFITLIELENITLVMNGFKRAPILGIEFLNHNLFEERF